MRNVLWLKGLTMFALGNLPNSWGFGGLDDVLGASWVTAGAESDIQTAVC
ncbi:MAG: hypothetical protein ACRERR_08585 [Moraxellaceae bacterium]